MTIFGTNTCIKSFHHKFNVKLTCGTLVKTHKQIETGL